MLEDVPLPRGSNRKASHAIAIDNSSAPIAAAISQATPNRSATRPPTRDATIEPAVPAAATAPNQVLPSSAENKSAITLQNTATTYRLNTLTHTKNAFRSHAASPCPRASSTANATRHATKNWYTPNTSCRRVVRPTIRQYNGSAAHTARNVARYNGPNRRVSVASASRTGLST